jgi:hypothetical protein
MEPEIVALELLLLISDPEQGEDLENLFLFPGDNAFFIGVFDAYEKRFFALYGAYVVEQGYTKMADVHIAGRAWGNTKHKYFPDFFLYILSETRFTGALSTFKRTHPHDSIQSLQ